MNQASTTPAGDLLFCERKIAARLGLSCEDMAFLREEILSEGADWRMCAADVLITPTGLEKILNRVDGERSTPLDFTPDQVTTPAMLEGQRNMSSPLLLRDQPDRPTSLVELTVVRVFPNVRLLQASTPAGVRVVVNVKMNKNFIPGMKLKARLLRFDRYEMEGRCPRSRGRY